MFQFTLAVALLPLVWASLDGLLSLGQRLEAEGWQAWWPYLAGAAGYLLVERILKKPMWLYVVGHELTHALSALLSGARIHSFRAKASGGEVRLSKSNAFIALSPYIIPLYALLTWGLYALVSLWWQFPWLTRGFQFLFGASLAFHGSLTLTAIHAHQSDLHLLGMTLSTVLILLGNSLILGLFGVSLFSRTPTLVDYLTGLAHQSARTYRVGLAWMWQQGDRHWESWKKEQTWIH